MRGQLNVLFFSLYQFPPFKYFSFFFFLILHLVILKKEKKRGRKKKRSSASLISKLKKKIDPNLWPVAVVNTSGTVLLDTEIVARSTQG